ncbi:hypothetical protein [Mucilaginibacter sp. AK015]|uniref:hypothetical protein n=1 Tax=Mucilaginibacter sp. AK015 TaxID=2723072 RepID=UPI0016138EC5|nr:hypothetical protein [Mucilaginibacter sp. AK015]MBB5395085.1 hypothetical protein [Mucilaginibacter sp. AK015]
MRNIAALCLLLINSTLSYAQSLDHDLKAVTDDLALKTLRKHVIRLGLLDFTNEEGKRDATVRYIQEQVEMNLINADGLEVMDRDHIRALLGENHLVSQGIIDESTVKKAVAFFKIDGWVEGKITNFGNRFKLRLKIININTSQVFAIAVSRLIDGTELRQLVEPKACNTCGGSGTIKAYLTCTECAGKGGRKCQSCNGSGIDAIASGLGNSSAPCQSCRGKGKTECRVCHGKGQVVTLNTCRTCKGTGKQL